MGQPISIVFQTENPVHRFQVERWKHYKRNIKPVSRILNLADKP